MDEKTPTPKVAGLDGVVRALQELRDYLQATAPNSMQQLGEWLAKNGPRIR